MLLVFIGGITLSVKLNAYYDLNHSIFITNNNLRLQENILGNNPMNVFLLLRLDIFYTFIKSRLMNDINKTMSTNRNSHSQK